MTKQQFINELTAALSQVDLQTRDEIMADINEHFTEGAAHGLSDEDICIKLGQPGQIAAQVLEEYSDAQNNTHIFEDLKAFKAGKQHSSDARRIRGGYDINIDSYYDNINSIDIDLKISDINIVTAPQGSQVRLTMQGHSKYNTFTIDNKNGCLLIKEQQPMVRFEIFRFKTTLETTIYVPAGFIATNIDAYTGIGNIKLTGISCDAMKLKTSVGNIAVKDCTVDNGDIKSSAGNITISGGAMDRIDAKSSAGNVTLTGCAADCVSAKSSAGNINFTANESESLSLHSSAGTINVQVARLLGDTNLSSSAGSVRLEAREVGGNITAKSSCGSVKIYLPQDVNCRIITKKPSVGSVNNSLTGNPNSPYVLSASTSIGSVTLEAI